MLLGQSEFFDIFADHPMCHSGLDPESSPALILPDSRLHGNDEIVNNSKDSGYQILSDSVYSDIYLRSDE